MTRDEFIARTTLIRTLQDEVAAGCPWQIEDFSDGTFMFWDIRMDHLGAYKAYIHRDGTGFYEKEKPMLVGEDLVRWNEVNGRLNGWARNEGDWPLAKGDEA